MSEVLQFFAGVDSRILLGVFVLFLDAWCIGLLLRSLECQIEGGVPGHRAHIRTHAQSQQPLPICPRGGAHAIEPSIRRLKETADQWSESRAVVPHRAVDQPERHPQGCGGTRQSGPHVELGEHDRGRAQGGDGRPALPQ